MAVCVPRHGSDATAKGRRPAWSARTPDTAVAVRILVLIFLAWKYSCGGDDGQAEGCTAKLEAAGLVRRERDADDRRVVYIGLTEKGLTVTDRVVEAHFANERGMLAGLTQTERAQLAKLLSRLEHSLDLSEIQDRDTVS